MKSVLIIGGNGIVGSAVTKEALQSDYEVTTLGLGDNQIRNERLRHLSVDRNDIASLDRAIEGIRKQFDAVFDVIGNDENDAHQIHKLFRGTDAHIFVMSTTLVYDRSSPTVGAIKSTDKLAETGTMGGYVDKKLSLENYWRGVNDLPYTVLRPYHVVGPGSFLGCTPPFNRSPNLLDLIKSDQAIPLCEGGKIPLNTVHPTDIAKVVLNSIGDSASFGKSYNVVNPEIVYGDQYYKEIGRLLGKEVTIGTVPVTEIWNRGGWELTTLPHVYDVSDLKENLGFVPSIALSTSIADAIATYPDKFSGFPMVHERMNLPPRPQRIHWVFNQ